MIITYGEVLWDLLPSGKQLGGAVANCSLRLQKLGHQVAFISRLGSDDLGVQARNILQAKGLSCDYIQTDELHPTGTVDVSLNSDGDADYVINKEVAYDFIEINQSMIELAKNARAIVFGNLIQRNSVSGNTLYQLLETAPQALKVIDINIRKDCYTTETVRESVQRTDVLKLNDKEVVIVSDMLKIPAPSYKTFCEAISEKFHLQSVLISLGSKGTFAYDTTEGYVELPAYNIKIADTVGAGDNFTAGFTHKRLQGKSFHECCDFANLLGALAATKPGGMPEITDQEIGDLQQAGA
jgi:fructokinase